MHRIRLLLLILLIASNVGEVKAQQATSVETFQVSQANVQLPRITAYLDITDKSGEPIELVESDQLSGTLGKDSLKVNSIQPFSLSKEGIAYVFLIDISRSLSNQEFDRLRNALTIWIKNLRSNDYVSLITFGDSVSVLQDFSTQKDTLEALVKGLKATDSNTQFYFGLEKAIAQKNRTDSNLPTRRMIITLSDGMDDSPREYNKEAILRALAIDPIPMYALGFKRQGANEAREKALNELSSLVRSSGGVYFETNRNSIEEMHTVLRNRIQQTWIAQLQCSSCTGDNAQRFLRLKFNLGNTGYESGIEVRARPDVNSNTVTVARNNKSFLQQYLPFFLGGIALLMIVGFLLWNNRRKATLEPSSEELKNSLEPDTRNTESEIIEEEVVSQPSPNIPKLSIVLTVVDGIHRGYTEVLEVIGEVVLGRKTESLAWLSDDDAISSAHCKLTVDDKLLIIEDLASTNRTYVNGVPIFEPMHLQEGDILLLGGTEMRVNYSG